MTRWLRSHAFAANAFASYPLHGPRVEVVTTTIAYDPNAGRRRRPLQDDERRRRQDEEDLAWLLIHLAGEP